MIDISSLAERMIERNKNSNNLNLNQTNINQSDTLNKNNFKFLYVIGKGGFGRVWKIQSKKTKIKYALKEMSKLKIIDKKSEKSIKGEREFLSKLNHPFIVNMHYAFQDKDNLYLVMDLLKGGDLRFHISRYRKFSEEQTRFFIANMVYALEYIHNNNVIHRDIKPENLVLDEKGYARITDFGIAKENMPDNSSETSGTPGYMAPEVMKGRNHSFPVDFFALGVIGYEFMTGSRPYSGKNRKEIKEQMLSKPAIINEENIAPGWSQESADFINKLLERKDSKRLGFKEGTKELMNHHWLKYYPWKELKEKTLLAPFIPDPKDNFDKSYCESIEKISEETRNRYEEIYYSENFRKIFIDFYYNEDEIIKQKKEKEKKEKEEKEKEKKLKTSCEIENKSKNDNYIQKYSVNSIGGHNNFINKDKELIDQNKNKLNGDNNNNNMNYIKNITSNVIKNIRVNKINNNSSNQNGNNINSNSNIIIRNRERSNISSINNTNKKEYYTNKYKINKNTTKKPLSHSNSTKEIYSNNSMEKYLKINKNNITQRKNPNKNQIHNYIKQKIINNNNNNKYNKIPLSSRGTGTSIDINNYYTNNIFNAIYNNFIPYQNFEKKNNGKIKSKKKTQRSSSVFYQKRSVSIVKLAKNKIKNKNDSNKIGNKLNYRK